MTTARQSSIPIDHVVAEAAAFPLASEAALHRPVTALSRSLSGATRDLWRSAERHLVGTASSVSPEELLAIRDRVWFFHEDDHERVPNDRIPLDTYVRRIASHNFECFGSVLKVREDRLWDSRDASRDERAALARTRARWIRLALPPDLLMAALGAREIDLLSERLARRLADDGFAELHQHVGAAIDFPTLWLLTLHAVADPQLPLDAFFSPGAALDEGRELGSWILLAGVVRLILAAAVSQGAVARQAFEERIWRRIGAWAPLRGWPSGVHLLYGKLREFEHGRLQLSSLEYAELRLLMRTISGHGPERRPDRVAEVASSDPLSHYFPSIGRTAGEADLLFTTAALRALDTTRDTSARFAGLFWQLVRVRGLYYRHIVQRPLTPGLQWFIRHYARLAPAKRGLSKAFQVKSSARIDGADVGLRSLEVRFAPDRSISGMLEDFKSCENGFRAIRGWTTSPGTPSDSPFKAFHASRARYLARHAGFPTGAPDLDGATERPPIAGARDGLEFGVVLHFVKDRGGGTLAGTPPAHGARTHAQPASDLRTTRVGPLGPNTPALDRPVYRFASYYRSRLHDMMSMVWLLDNFPHALRILRGVDICTDELGVPTWVLAPIYRAVRAAGDRASAYLRRWHGQYVPGLRATVHAGEDFVHLLTGLRNLDLAIDQLGLREGDRIGHGMALGVHATQWAERAGRIAMPRDERLWDLVWEWRWHGTHSGCHVPGRLGQIEYEIKRHAQEIFGSSWYDRDEGPPGLYQLALLQQDLGDRAALRAIGYPDPHFGLLTRKVHGNRRRALMQTYLADPAVFRRGRRHIWVEPAAEAEVLESLQSALRGKVAARGLVVEVNPTSNLLIGDLADLEGHPLWRLDPPQGDGTAPTVPICVGSDDPITFASDIRSEYQAMHDALVCSRLGDEQARRWIERVRQSSLDSRFTLDRQESTPVELSLAALFVGLPPALDVTRTSREWDLSD